MHLVLGLTAAVLLSLLVSIGLVYLVRQHGERYRIEGTRDVEGIYMVALATLYGIFVAFMIFATWTRYYDTIESADAEANALANVYRLAGDLPKAQGDEVRRGCGNYAKAMFAHEWSAMARGMESAQGAAAAEGVWLVVSSLDLASRNDTLHDHLLTETLTLLSLRRHRLLQAHTSLPAVLTVLLIVGAIIVVVFAAVFSVDDFVPHALKTCLLSFIIALMLYAVFELDRPYSGDVAVSREAFREVLHILGQK